MFLASRLARTNEILHRRLRGLGLKLILFLAFRGLRFGAFALRLGRFEGFGFFPPTQLTKSHRREFGRTTEIRRESQDRPHAPLRKAKQQLSTVKVEEPVVSSGLRYLAEC